MNGQTKLSRLGHPLCQMPGCWIEVPAGEQYCVACEDVKKIELERAA